MVTILAPVVAPVWRHSRGERTSTIVTPPLVADNAAAGADTIPSARATVAASRINTNVVSQTIIFSPAGRRLNYYTWIKAEMGQDSIMFKGS
mgnify:CR=1 FL=1